MSLTGAIAAAAAIAAVIASLDDAIGQHNYQRAMKLKKKYDILMSQTNLKAQDIQRKLDNYNLNLNQVLSKYDGVSRAGRAFKNKGKIEKAIRENQMVASRELQNIAQQQAALTAEYQPKIDKLSNQGGLQTIFNGVGELVRKE